MRYKTKNNDLLIIGIFCAVAVVLFSVIVILVAKGNGDGGANRGAIPEGSDYLPDNLLGNWWIPVDGHVLQSPRNADMSEGEALADEYDFGVFLTRESYKTHRVGDIENPCYKITENCGTAPMDQIGMQSDGIMEEFVDNTNITEIRVYTTDGKNLCDTIFIIDDEYLVYYGTGNFVFCAAKMEAVG